MGHQGPEQQGQGQGGGGRGDHCQQQGPAGGIGGGHQWLRPAGNGAHPAGKSDPRASNPGVPAFTGLVGGGGGGPALPLSVSRDAQAVGSAWRGWDGAPSDGRRLVVVVVRPMGGRRPGRRWSWVRMRWNRHQPRAGGGSVCSAGGDASGVRCGRVLVPQRIVTPGGVTGGDDRHTSQQSPKGSPSQVLCGSGAHRRPRPPMAPIKEGATGGGCVSRCWDRPTIAGPFEAPKTPRGPKKNRAPQKSPQGPQG